MKKDTFSYYITKYFADYLPNQQGASVNTISSYRDTFVQLMGFLKERYRLQPEKLSYADFTVQRVEAFLDYLEIERKVGPSTRNQRLAAIHAFFRFIQFRNPAGFAQSSDIMAIPYKKTPSKPVSYMSIEEIAFLLTIPDQRNDRQFRDLAILALLYESGARVQELIDLTPDSIHFRSIVTVELHGKGNKTRLVPISPDAARIVKEYMRRYQCQEGQRPLFMNRQGAKLTRMGIQYIIDKYISLAKSRRPDLYQGHISNHSFRHSKAMHLLEAGVNLIYIRDLLGHQSVTTTEIYARTNPKIKEEQLVKYGQSIETPPRYTSKNKEDLISWLKNNI